VTGPAPQPPPVLQPPPGTIACPRCGAAVGPEQDWCVTCGVAARTRVAPVPHWRRPIVVVATVAALALATVAVALVSLSGSDAPPGAATVTPVIGPPINATTTTPAVTPGLETTIGTPTTIAPAVPPANGTAGTTTTPPATTTAPPATTTTPPATTTPVTPPTGGAAAP